MAKLSPSRISTVVEVSRRRKASMVKPPEVKPLVGSIDETAASISRLMRSPSTTRGMKFSSTPKGLYSTVTVPSSWATGTGYSPPARNFASCPDRAVRFGSASVRTTPRDLERLEQHADLEPAGVEAEDARALGAGGVGGEAPLPTRRPAASSDAGAAAEAPRSPPRRDAADRERRGERLGDTDRCISAKRTRSITCWVPPTVIRFDTLSGA